MTSKNSVKIMLCTGVLFFIVIDAAFAQRGTRNRRNSEPAPAPQAEQAPSAPLIAAEREASEPRPLNLNFTSSLANLWNGGTSTLRNWLGGDIEQLAGDEENPFHFYGISAGPIDNPSTDRDLTRFRPPLRSEYLNPRFNLTQEDVTRPVEVLALHETLRSASIMASFQHRCLQGLDQTLPPNDLVNDPLFELYGICGLDLAYEVDSVANRLSYSPQSLCECVNRRLIQEEEHDVGVYRPLADPREAFARAEEIQREVFETAAETISDMYFTLLEELHYGFSAPEFYEHLYELDDSIGRDFASSSEDLRPNALSNCLEMSMPGFGELMSVGNEELGVAPVCSPHSWNKLTSMLDARRNQRMGIEEEEEAGPRTPAAQDEDDRNYVLAHADVAQDDQLSRWVYTPDQRGGGVRERYCGVESPGTGRCPRSVMDFVEQEVSRYHRAAQRVAHEVAAHGAVGMGFGLGFMSQRQNYIEAANENRPPTRGPRADVADVQEELDDMVFDFDSRTQDLLTDRRNFILGPFRELVDHVAYRGAEAIDSFEMTSESIDSLRRYFLDNPYLRRNLKPEQLERISRGEWEDFREDVVGHLVQIHENRQAVEEQRRRSPDYDPQDGTDPRVLMMMTMSAMSRPAGVDMGRRCIQLKRTMASLCHAMDNATDEDGRANLTELARSDTFMGLLLNASEATSSGREPQERAERIHRLMTDASVLLCREHHRHVADGRFDRGRNYSQADPVSDFMRQAGFDSLLQIVNPDPTSGEGPSALIAAIVSSAGTVGFSGNSSACQSAYQNCDQLQAQRGQNLNTILSSRGFDPGTNQLAANGRLPEPAAGVHSLSSAGVSPSTNTRSTLEASAELAAEQLNPGARQSFSAANRGRVPASVSGVEDQGIGVGGQNTPSSEERLILERIAELQRQEQRLIERAEELRRTRESRDRETNQQAVNELQRELERLRAQTSREFQEIDRVREQRAQASEGVAQHEGTQQAGGERSGERQRFAEGLGGLEPHRTGGVGSPAAAGSGGSAAGAAARLGGAPGALNGTGGPSAALRSVNRGSTTPSTIGSEGLVLRQNSIHSPDSSLTQLALTAVGAVAFREADRPGLIERIVFRTENGEIVYENGHPVVAFREYVSLDQVELLADGEELDSDPLRAPASLDLAELVDIEQSMRRRTSWDEISRMLDEVVNE